VRITVRVKPGSRRGPLVETVGTDLVVYLREPGREGAANAALPRVLAEHFGTSPSRVSIVRGHSARIKQVEVDI